MNSGNVRLLLAAIMLQWLSACSGDAPSSEPGPTLLIAPFVEGQFYCDEAAADVTVKTEDEAALLCASQGKNGARRISALLDAVGPLLSKSGRYQLGYTLNLPVFRYFKKVGARWVFDQDFLAHSLSTITDVDRPVVIFLSADHFAVTNDALTAELAADPRNLMWTRDGPMQPKNYFTNPIVAWTLADQRATVNLMRTEAFNATRDAICRLPPATLAKIAAVSVLGETHDMFPNFETGPGYIIPMNEGTDYSPVSVNGFRVWLARKYGTIERLNSDLASSFASFEAINPPSRDIHSEVLANYFDHIDAAAAGGLPVYGWIGDARGRSLKVSVYLDGKPAGVARTGLSRTDVSAALTSLPNPNVGFHLDLNHRQLEYGFHTLEVFVTPGNQAPLRLAKQSLVVGDRVQGPAGQIQYLPVDAQPMSTDPDLIGRLDGPAPQQSIYYNPMAELWLLFRNEVVRNYVTQYAKLMVPSCIARSKLFSHQLAPTLYGGWNRDLLASDASQMPNEAYHPGTTLYGGTAFGDAFLAMKRQLGWTTYAVGEMHPIIALTPAQYFAMFELHRTNGAVYVAPYYMSTLRSESLSGTLSDFLISPVNLRNASDQYYRAMQDVMTK